MTIEQVIPYVSLALAVAGVVYGYVKKKSAAELAAVVADFNKGTMELHGAITAAVNSMKQPLEAAVKQLPKTRSKRASVEVEVNDDPPTSAA